MALKTKNPKSVKMKAIESITNDLKDASSFVFTEYRGLTVQQITELRTKLKKENCTYKVVRNNFARIAFENLDINDVDDYLVGPVALAYVNEDANAVAKTLFDYAKAVPSLVIKCAIVDGEFYDAQKFEEFSKLPGKSQLIAMFMSTINATTSKFVRTLQAIVDKGDTTPASTDSASAEPATEVADEKPVEASGDEDNTPVAE